MNKAPNVACKFCNAGCTIYNKRPEPCKDFNCEWLVDENIPEELRPDKSHVIFEKIFDTGVYVGLADPNYITTINKKPLTDFIQALNDREISVIMSSFSTAPKLFFLPKGVQKEDIVKLVNNSIKMNT